MLIFVEGESDRAALEAAAAVLAIDLGTASIRVMSGATNATRFVTDAVSARREFCGLYDAAEQVHIAQALTAAGITAGPGAAAMEAHGFFACDPDLESELIAVLGVDRVVTVIAAQGADARRFRSLQQMPEWRERPPEDQLRRWFGSGGSRKVRYAALLVAAMRVDEVPRPLRALLEHATA